MEFTCLWSKDGQQKKRKRWTDGIARFSSATGILSIWDQDASMKVCSARLKPDEAATMLQEDGDETRVGGVSIQIMAQVQQQQQRENHDAESHPRFTGNARPSIRPLAGAVVLKTAKLSTTGGGGGGGGGNGGHSGGPAPGPRRPGFKPLVSRLIPQPHQDGTSSNDGAIAPTPAPSTTAEVSADFSAARPGALGGTGIRKLKTPRGVGGARHFQAPRSSGVAAAASRGITTRDVIGTSPLVASRTRSNAAVQHSPGLVRASRTPGDRPVERVSVSSGKRSGGGDGPNPDVHPEDLVLEWTTGDSPQPLRAGASLARRLHPHQREGLKMLWECLAGRGGYEGRGAILADEMGLGKTATAIALCTCVLRHRRTECRKVVVVCPSSLVKNWANEFRKWCPLGGGAVAVDQAGTAAAKLVADFKIGAPSRYPILVISYELYRNHGSVINATEGLGLLVADEGHRLKNSSETKTTKALKACPAVMRLVLTGTPMQNHLDEFFAVADFVNPGLLGSLKSFRSRYTRPIKAAWDREVDEHVAELAAERTRELGDLTEKFVLRRTKDIMRGSVPAALEVVIFCRPSQKQLSLYERCIASSASARALLDETGLSGDKGGTGGKLLTMQGVLPLISKLRRLCNHPDLIDGHGCSSTDDNAEQGVETQEERAFEDEDDELETLFLEGGDTASADDSAEFCAQAVATNRASGGRSSVGSWKVPRPSGRATTVQGGAAKAGANATGKALESTGSAMPKFETNDSGKVLVLQALLRVIRSACPGDKVVVTSNFTSALDVLGGLADNNGWGYLRLDGGTASNERQSLVDRFNKAPPEKLFLFFLSARAGGVGLNLVGANRIVLFDSDWNPATDDQAMARVWRLGQTKEVSMYRLLSTGTLEESIFQRQIFKGALYDLIQDSNRPSTTTPAPYAENEDRTRLGRGTVGRGNNGAKGRGFRQEELKELFVLKRDTKSDTFDKLSRQRRAILTEGCRQQQTPQTPAASGDCAASEAILEDDEDGNDSSRGGRCAETDFVCQEEWKEYTGPSGVLDGVLRRALLETDDEGGVTTTTAGETSTATAVGSVITFVRELKRGGAVFPKAE